MTPEQLERVSEILENALALDRTQRKQFLDDACAGDEELRREVESLLDSHLEAGSSFLKTPEAGTGEIAPRPSIGPGSRIGPYDIVEKIGHGGMGDVFSAVRADGQYEKQVAIKLVRSGYDSESILERFRNERQILAGLDHPNIAKLLDGGTTPDGIPYLVMELVEGAPIDAYCDTRKLSITARLHLFRKVCGAVQYAHQHLVIHRDIKPSNILVSDGVVPKLLDFGIAKILDASGAAEATLLRPMTPEYASPEQIRGEPITTSTDMYSLGVVLYQLLTGRSPYRLATRTPEKLAEAITSTEPERPSASVQRSEGVLEGGAMRELAAQIVSNSREATPMRLQHRLRGDLDFILLKVLRKEPSRRYASVDQFSEDIRNHLEGLPVTARKGTWTYRADKFIRRHKAVVAASALVLLTLLTGIIVFLREAQIAETNRQRAEMRFNEVRTLANSLIFEVHDSIATLPGATRARKLILEKSLKYLDGLSHESGGDISLQRELAAAYERVGSVQGNAFEAHLGDPEAAFRSYHKALSIRQAVAAAQPGDAKDQIALARTYRLVGEVQWISLSDTSGSLDNLKKSTATAEFAAKLAPHDQTILIELAESFEKLGDVQAGNGPRGSAGEIQEGLQSHRNALEVLQQIASRSSGDTDLLRDLARAYLAVGDDLVKIGERDQGLVTYRKAMEILQPLARDSNNTLVLRRLTSCYSRIGDALVLSGKPEEAIEYFQKQLHLSEPMAIADPSDVDLRTRVILARASLGNALVEANRQREGLGVLKRSLAEAEKLSESAGDSYDRTILAFVEVWVGEAEEKIGDSSEALKYYARALERYSTIARADPQDKEDTLNVSAVSGHLGLALLRKGELNEAAERYQKAVEMALSAAVADAENMEVLYALADAFGGMGDVEAAKAQQAVSVSEKREHWKEARVSYQKSLDAWAKIPNPTVISPNGFKVLDLRHVTAGLAGCDRALTARF